MSRTGRRSASLRRALQALAGWVAALTLAPASGSAPTADSPVDIRILSPAPGAAVSNRVHQAQIKGSATASGEKPLFYDVMLAIDVSGSTEEASGSDVDGDGVVGVNPRKELIPAGQYPVGLACTDPGDTVLAAEIAAARALVATLDPRRVRVGIVTFSGEADLATHRRARRDQQDAWLEVPLTTDYRAVMKALQRILARGPLGATNFAAALRLSIVELAGLTGARSQPRPEASKVILFLTDGRPSFPYGKSNVTDDGDIEAALAAARLADKAGITINSYALGPDALTYPVAVTEMARVTQGTFMPVRNPGEIVTFLQAVSFANVDDVVITNVTTREVSTDVELAPDGSFTGFVPVKEGTNRVRVTALASDGSSGSVEFEMEFETAGLSSRELALELERVRERNKHLMLLIERDRIQRFRELQRKALELEIEDPPAPEG